MVAAVIFGTHAGICRGILSAGTITLASVLVLQEIVTPIVDMNAYAARPLSWIFLLVCFSFQMALILGSLIYFHRSLSGSITGL